MDNASAHNLFGYPEPEGLSRKGKKAMKVILKVAKECGMSYTGGCTPFYSPSEWKDRGESYGTESLLVVCHDGGDLEGFFSPYEAIEMFSEKLIEALAAEGMFFENCTGWYTAIYEA
jgi:hypothetical protein